MSLTSNLNNTRSPVRRFLQEQFPDTRSVVRECNRQMAGITTIRPQSKMEAHVAGLIGTALDYRLRYYFAVTSPNELFAWRGMLGVGGV